MKKQVFWSIVTISIIIIVLTMGGFYMTKPAAEARQTEELVLVARTVQTPNLTVFVYVYKDYSGNRLIVVAHDSFHGTVSVSQLK